MTVIDKYAQQRADVQFLVMQQFPTYRALQAAGSSTSLGVPNSKDYLDKALALEKELQRTASTDPEKFATLVREGRFRALGKLLSFPQCPAFIAEKLYPDDGYAATIEQREKCKNDYALVVHLAVLSGLLPMINPHTKAQFDRARLLPVHFHDGLIPVNRISDCLRQQDLTYIHHFPKRVPTPVKVSEFPAPITPIRASFRSTRPAQEAAPEKKVEERQSAVEISPPESKTSEGIQLWEIADEYANANRVDGERVSLNNVCQYLVKNSTQKRYPDLLTGGKGGHGPSWLKSPNRLAGWVDPKFRK